MKVRKLSFSSSLVGVAQLVEHITHKDKVASSILAVDTTQDIALFSESVYTLATAGVAQLVRALPCHGRGRGFESLRSRSYKKAVRLGLLFCITGAKRRDSNRSGGVPLGRREWGEKWEGTHFARLILYLLEHSEQKR